jgi:hypothetical protein
MYTNFSVTASGSILDGVAGKVHRIYGIVFVGPATAETIQLRSGAAGTEHLCSAAAPASTSFAGGTTLPVGRDPWFITDTAANLILTKSGANPIGGLIVYDELDP